ncbi:phage repressor protein [Haloarcula sp. KBTZ06]|nr:MULTISPECIES: phage repressor protein [Haloarcula]
MITEEGEAYLDEEYDAEEGVYIDGENSISEPSPTAESETNGV